jgi:Big-like domain-containing protein
VHRLSGRLGSFVAGLGALAVLAHCGSSDLTLPSESVAGNILKVDGDRQTGAPGWPLAESLAVKVTDSRGAPAADQRVAFQLDTDAPGADVRPAEARTGADGVARAQWVLGSSADTQAVVAGVVGSNGLKVRFEASAGSGDAVHIKAVSGDGQSGSVGSALAGPLVVRVTDQFGNPVANVAVEWNAGGGSADPSASTTGADGQATMTWTLGSRVGSQTATASSSSLDGSPVTFTATAGAGSADRLVQVSGNNQTASPGAELPQPLVVRLLDREGNGVSGRAVTWVVGAGGGSVGSSTSNTDGDGKATAHWTLGPASGTNTLNAVVSGVGVVGFTAIAGSQPAELAFRVQPSDTRVDKKISPAIEVVVLDAAGQRFTGREIEIKLELTGDQDGRLGGHNTEHTRSGVATFSDLSVNRRGTYRLHATADGVRAADSDRFDVHSKHGGDGED